MIDNASLGAVTCPPPLIFVPIFWGEFSKTVLESSNKKMKVITNTHNTLIKNTHENQRFVNIKTQEEIIVDKYFCRIKNIKILLVTSITPMKFT